MRLDVLGDCLQYVAIIYGRDEESGICNGDNKDQSVRSMEMPPDARRGCLYQKIEPFYLKCLQKISASSR